MDDYLAPFIAIIIPCPINRSPPEYISSNKLNERNYYGGTALIVATLHSQVEIVQYLLRKKADVNAQTLKGYTALHVAAKHGFTTITQMLVDKGKVTKVCMTSCWKCRFPTLFSKRNATF